MTEETTRSEPRMTRRVPWIRVVIVLSAVLLAAWLVCWYVFWIGPQVSMDAGGRFMWPESGTFEESRRARRLVYPWGMLALAVAGVVELFAALLAARRRWVPRAWSWALGLTGAALLVLPVLVFATAGELLLPAVPEIVGG